MKTKQNKETNKVNKMKTEQKKGFSVFGQKPESGSIFLSDIPMAVRLNCKDGGVFLGGSEPKHRKSNPDDKLDIAILSLKKYYGSMGKTYDCLWLQMFFVPVNDKILPANTVCVGYLKKQSITNLFGKAMSVMGDIDPCKGIFTLSFERQQGEKGVYYQINFDWKKRTTPEELSQLDAIEAFMEVNGEQLVDFDGTRDMTCVDGMTSAELAELQRGISVDESLALPTQVTVTPVAALPRGR